jgi:hypothetical protein
LGLLAMQLPVLILALIGGYWTIKGNRTSFLPMMLIVYFALVYSVICPYGRYSLPIMPYVLMFSAHSLDKLGSRLLP